MKRFFRLFAVILLLTTLNSQAQLKSLEASVEELTELLINPNKGDLQSLSHFKLSYGHSSGLVENRDEFIAALLKADFDFQEIDISNQSIEIIDKTAIVRHDMKAKALSLGKPTSINLRIMTVWLKQKKGWVLFARQAVKI
ncbi:nuclear transport factor 2 family protein [Jiulongibacter sediminis]|uniref:DUF4440 domain-containing protein n=1 Tax=Jiulongibacter sediminis TaxID=1605367 RepID=A0A0P7C1Q6_9BACT|nr:nuclear transport factor 2 family protein [Jiulongibacter sediminis]KPM47248.1 hypothetical protein AFM12_15735 [Jiulongibacter sediminis]TBX22806.1 hypothetical protein TK44_15745 [Jiulongibacter sediminis]